MIQKGPEGLIYPSKIDAWIVIVVAMSPMTAWAVAIVLWTRGNANDALTLFIVGLAVLLFVLLLVYPCRYTLGEQELAIRSGLSRSKVSYGEIVSVQKMSSMRSGPALSLIRVMITTNRRTILISPVHRDEFIEQIQQRIDDAKNSG